ncbi:hypothetical protein KSF_002420 [Reticulibacter mediterranei]|uniref:DDE domain-containing protein n=1 Tax=Reticulibacter mediterranei TaxID=2778369 RepID=A0A8J3I7F5_9CHLR|nr:hypothetical protein KSF_002420 [Reticulibacter mediterranei]
MAERGLHVDYTTIFRWVQRYAPELEKRCRPYLRTTTNSWRVDETYIKIKTEWFYLYRAIDSQGSTLEFLLSPTRDAEAAKGFFCKALHTTTGSAPQVSSLHKLVALPTAPAEPTISTILEPRVSGAGQKRCVSQSDC